MIDNKTIRKVIMLNKMLPGGSPTYENREASGAVANFTTNVAMPFVSLDCEILPIQEGTGTPSPSNPRPISGTSVLNVEQRGKNILNPNSEIVPHSTYGFFPLCHNNTPLTMTLFDNDTGVDISDVSFGFSLSLTENGAQSEISNGFVWRVISGAITGRTDNVMGGKYCDQFVFFPKTQTTLEKIFQRFNIVVSVGTTTATTYEPYQGTEYSVVLGRTIYGGSADVVGGTGEETHELITLDGSEAWNVHGSIASCFYLDGAFPDAFIDGEKNDFAVCNCGVQAKYQNVSGLTNGEFALGLTGNRIRFVFKNTDCATIEDFKTWLSSNNMQVAYTLATPESFTFTGQPINSYLGVNNVWTDSGDTKVTYKYKTGEGGSTKKKYLPIFYNFYGKE